MKLTRRTWLAWSSLAAVAAAQEPQGSAEKPRWVQRTPRETIRRRYFPDLVLRTHEGKAVRFYDDLIQDKIVTLNFMYATCQGICVPTTANLVKVQKLLGERVGRDLFMYSITLDPEKDTPEILKAYAETHGVGRGWSFLTGEPRDIETLRRKLNFVDPDPALDRDKSSHTAMLRFGNEPQQLWAACNGLVAAESIVEAIGWVAGEPGRASAPARER